MKIRVAFSLLLILSFSVVTVGESKTPSNPRLDLVGRTWDHSEISVEIVAPKNLTGWKASYENSVLCALGQWNEAIKSFALEHEDYAFLADLRLVPNFSNNSHACCDVRVLWRRSIEERTFYAGLASLRSTTLGQIEKSSIVLSTCDYLGESLGEVDMQNIAAHEFGHVLGLGHGDHSGDLMFYGIPLRSSLRGISTLDVYGVSLCFQWMANASELDEVGQIDLFSSASLPPSVGYELLPVSDKYVVCPSWPIQILVSLGDFGRLIVQSKILTSFLLLTAFGVVVLLVWVRKKVSS